MPHRLQELQPRHHAAIRMRIEGRSTEQISRALEVKPRTLYIWFSDPLVKQALAEQLERFNEIFAERYAAACLAAIDAAVRVVNQPVKTPPTEEMRLEYVKLLLDRHPATMAMSVKLREIVSYAHLLPPEELHRTLRAATGLPLGDE
jgi:AcrR family transcriptional regulator